ncbi:MAG: serine hydroxymethyltransferase [Chloroherpetonaceae bacterium]|nr:serine hydroxymethyltransferase [Chthonomonadaceae bacterium]MDW8207252.1 serine hydroxymethyltransferase [Chloroherpetonaceae bacterium]
MSTLPSANPLRPEEAFIATASNLEQLRVVDPEVYEIAVQETRRQSEIIRLIPSENYTTAAVMQAMATVFCNKYSEGYPGRRYYEGNELIDALEALACERARKLFGADHANVQPHSGSPANMAAYFALLKPGQKVMGMHLPSGGHLTHGWNVNFSGILYQSVFYGHNEAQGVTGLDPKTGMLDYEEIRRIALRERPAVIFAGGTAYPRQWDFAKFREIADEVDAYLVADIAHINGLIVGGVHPDPVPYADVVTSTSHKAIRGPRGGFILCKDRPMKDDPAQRLPDRIDKAVFPTLQGGPHQNTIAALAVCFREAMTEEFRQYARQIVANARALARALMDRGFVLVTGGTDNHLILIDVMRSRGIPGKPFARALYEAGIETNFNAVPNDPRKPFSPSGLRIGTPAVTTRGFREEQMEQIAEWMDRVAACCRKDGKDYPFDEAALRQIRGEVRDLCLSGQFPIPGIDI